MGARVSLTICVRSMLAVDWELLTIVYSVQCLEFNAQMQFTSLSLLREVRSMIWLT